MARTADRSAIVVKATHLALRGAIGAAAAVPAWAQVGAAQEYDLPAGPLSASLARLATESGLRLSADTALVGDRAVPPLRGRYTVRQALDALLVDSGLDAVVSGGAITIVAASPAAAPDQVIVTGSSLPRLGDRPAESGFAARYQDSATKMALELRETPQAVSVITRESMDARQALDANTALELASGVVSGAAGQGGPFAGRGLSTGGNFNLRGQDLNPDRDILVDGFAVSSAAFDLAAFERVEAIKGPSSTVYGQGSLGGFVNMVRKRPQAELLANAAVQLGSFGMRRVEGDVAGAMDADAQMLGRLTAVYDDSKSFTDGVETRVGLIAPSLEWRIGERSRALFQVLYQKDDYIPSQGVPLKLEGDTARAPRISRRTFVGMPSSENSDSDNLLGSVRVDHQVTDKWLATLVLQGNRSDMHRIFDSYGYSFTGLAGGLVTLEADTARIENRNWAGELRLDGRFEAFGREHRALIGAAANQRKNRTAFGYAYIAIADIYADNFAAYGTVPGGAGSLPFNVDNSNTSKNQSVYGQVLLSLLDRTKLLIGTRYDWSEQSRVDNLSGAGDSQRVGAWTSRIGLVQELTPSLNAYASYAQSFNPVDAYAKSGEILQPERGTGYEIGLKGEWLDKRLQGSLAVFQQELDDRPIADPTDPNFSISSGLQRTKGLELEISGTPYAGVTIGAAGTWLNNRYVDPQDPDYGLRPYDTVDRFGAVFGSYQIQAGPLEGLGFGATWATMGKRSLSFAGAGAFYGNGSDAIFVPGYQRWDLNVYYRGLPNWDFSLQVRNVTDRTYIERVRDVSGSNYFGSPRAVLFRADYRFF